MDIIRIENLKIFAHHGVFGFENENGQNFYINADLHVDTERAGIEDALELSVDYSAVCALMAEVMTTWPCKLIEAAAQNVAMEVLMELPLVQRIDLEIRKPEAPIQMEFESVSVKISRSWHTAVIALGSNLGDSRSYIEAAVREIQEHPFFRNVQVSDLIETKPYGYTEQNDFLNGVLICETVFSPHRLLEFLQNLEQKANRTREIHWGPRTLDLDVIFYDNEIISEKKLIVPHPDMQNRWFVLEPLAQIAPYYRHPILGKTAAQLLEELDG